MASGSGDRDPPQPPPPPDLAVFQALISSYSKSAKGAPLSRFVKRLDVIPKVLSTPLPRDRFPFV
jgi:hypothetical protein